MGERLNYEPGLDGLRGIAILGVMGFHFADFLVTGGALGVDVFFVLSGYLITTILLKEREVTGNIDYLAFLGRRVRRLLPALIALLIAYLTLCPWLFPAESPTRWRDAATASFYVTNLRESVWPIDNPLSHTWSLSIEEQFYLLWPFLLPIVARKLDRATISLFAAWCLLTACRSLWAVAWPGSPATYYLTPLHATGLVAGCWLAFSGVTFRWGILAAAVLLILLIFGQSRQHFLLMIPLAELATVAVIAGLPKFLSFQPFVHLGRVSYGVYLWHIPIYWLYGRPHNIQDLGLLFAFSIGAGTVSYLLVERWFLRHPGKERKTLRFARP